MSQIETIVTPDRIMQLGLGFWGSKALLSAIELGLFTILAEGPADAPTLRHRLGIHPRGTLDFLDALVAIGMLDRADGIYRNTPETDRYLDRHKPSYIGGVLEMANGRLYEFWGRLTEGLKTGEPQNEMRSGGGMFEALYADPQRLRSFLGAMTGISLGSGQAIARQFPWTDYTSVADMGTAQGGVLVQIALAQPHLTAIGFDLPAVRPVFEEYVASHDLSDRVTFVDGSFFSDPWPSADVFVLGHILHDWSLDEKKQLLSRAYNALPSNGAVIVHESLIDDDRRRNAFGLLMSLNMLIETSGGFDYTGADAQRWMREVGFRETRVEPLVGPDSMVIGIK